jgi:CspA family cold shock protein
VFRAVDKGGRRSGNRLSDHSAIEVVKEHAGPGVRQGIDLACEDCAGLYTGMEAVRVLLDRLDTLQRERRPPVSGPLAVKIDQPRPDPTFHCWGAPDIVHGTKVGNWLRRPIMSTGTVKWFNPTKGYGFIQPQGGGQDVFVHISAVERAGLSTLSEGQHVEYEIVNNRGRSSAENLKVK